MTGGDFLFRDMEGESSSSFTPTLDYMWKHLITALSKNATSQFIIKERLASLEAKVPGQPLLLVGDGEAFATINSMTSSKGIPRFGRVLNIQEIKEAPIATSTDLYYNTSLYSPGAMGFPMHGRVGAEDTKAMDDKDVSRLEDRIRASQERSTLRLESAMATLNATLGRILEQNTNLAIGIKENQSSSRAWGQWIIGTIIVSVLALAAVAVGLKQVWLGGFGEGQTAQEAVHNVPSQPASGK